MLRRLPPVRASEITENTPVSRISVLVTATWVHGHTRVTVLLFAILDLEAGRCSVKCSHEAYAELVEREDIEPAFHNMWRNQWVTIESLSALPDREFRAVRTAAYEFVRAGLSRKIRAELDAGRPAAIKPWVPKARRSAARRKAR